MGRYAKLFRLAQYNHKHPYKGKKEAGESESKRERFEDVLLLMWKVEEGARSQGTQAVSRSWKRQGNGSFTGTSRRDAALPPCFGLLMSRL